MPRILAAIAGAIAIAMPAWGQVPDGPPATPQLVSVSPDSASPAFLDVTFAEREMRDGVMVGRFWLINVFREPTPADDKGIADGSWSMYEAKCGETQVVRIISYWVDYSGWPVITIPADPTRTLTSGSGSPLDAGANLSCRGVKPDGERHATVNDVVNVVRKN